MEANLGKHTGSWYGIEPGDVCHVCPHVSWSFSSFATLLPPLLLVGFCRYFSAGGFLVLYAVTGGIVILQVAALIVAPFR